LCQLTKWLLTFAACSLFFKVKWTQLLAFFVEQQDTPVVKYSASSIYSVIYSILIDDYESRLETTGRGASWLLAGQIVKQACSYRIKGSSDQHCRASDIRIAIETMSRDKSIKLHDFQDGIVYCELPKYMRENIDHYKKIHYSDCGRPITHKTEYPHIGKTINRNEVAYQKEKAKQDAIKGHYVYYIQWDNDTGFVKIGYSSSPMGRITGFLTGSPRNLRLLRLEPVASVQEEVSRHLMFDEYRHAREWFRYEGGLKEYIQSLSVNPAIKLWERLPAASKGSIDVEYF
jgi:hypothetical protein